MMGGRRSHSHANGDNQQTNSPEIINCNQYPIIGIDLGISYWSAAFVQNGKVHVVPFFGQNNMPAFVAYLKDEFKFGNEAKKMFFDNREVTIFDMLYILGLRFNSGGELEEHMNDYSYAISNFGDKPKLSFTYKNSDISIEELFDIIINHLIYTSEIFLNETIRNIVVPIPAYFKESQKSALLKATTHVGIIELIPEPIAAAYAYRIHEKYKNDPEDRYFLIYNLQEDNIDVSVVQYANNKFHIKSNLYERHLKRNYAFRFLDELCTQTYETYFISNPRFHPLNSGTLRYYCKTMFEDILHADCFEIEMDTIQDEKIVRTISRAELDELLRILVQESLVFVKNVLHKANLETRDIDEVLFVGQITRHAIVKHHLKYLFGKKSLNFSLNPEDVLVTGAALRADILQREISENKILPKPMASSKRSNNLTGSYISLEKLNITECFESYHENIRKHSGSNKCFEAEDFERKLLHKQKFKQKLTKNDSIKRRKTKLSLRDKMLSMCSLFSTVVNGSNLKVPVKEKLLFVSSYLCNKLRCRSKSTKKSYDKYNIKEEHRKNVCFEHKENCGEEQDKFQDISKHPEDFIKSEEMTNELNFHGTDLIFDTNIQPKFDQVSSNINKKEKINKLLSEYVSLDSDYEDINLLTEKAENRHQENLKWSLMDKVNCIRQNLDIFYVTVCIVVFLLHWASENICINIAIALISIAITLILNNRVSVQKSKKHKN